MRLSRLILGSILVGAISCSALRGPQAIQTSRIETPKIWAAAKTGNNARISKGWLGEFGDARMTKLVNEALAHNFDLKATAARLRAAKEGTIIGRSARLPSLNASTSYRRSGTKQTSIAENYSLSLNASWEADLWGRLRNSELASRADYASTLADFRGSPAFPRSQHRKSLV